MRFRQNESVAAKRRVAMYLYMADGVTPVPLATNWNALAASVALTGTHHATLTTIATGIAQNSVTIALAADGTGAGSLTNSGSAYTFHYQTGVTTMANFVTAAAAVFAFSGHTPTDVLVSTGDTQGPLAFTGGADQGFQIRQGATSYIAASGTWTNTGVDGEWVYEATQAELNFIGSELGIKVARAGYLTRIVTCEQNDAADFNSICEGSYQYGDYQRLIASVLAFRVSDFRTGTQAFLSLNAAKTRITGTTDASGRLTSTIGDLTP